MWATAPGTYTEDSGMLQPLAQRAYYSAETARTFTERSLSFPQSASYHYTRQKTTRDTIFLWQTGFHQGVCTPSEPPPHMPSSDGIGTRFRLLVRSQGYNVLPPHMLPSGSIGTRSGLGNASSESPPHMPPSDGIGTRSGPSVRLQIQGSSYHIKSYFKGNSWYEITNNEGNEILPSHLQGGPWFQTYQGVKAANNSPLFACLMQVMCNHAPIGEYRVRFFPKEPYKLCQCDLKSPEMRQHLLMVCPYQQKGSNVMELYQ
ncbi:hypothetical protein AGABI2DRAFT_122547 [Agaricus bisporus var. bisporus H97]|uniref:hypothetical protein n=1 Tax=Agaricus bisporus var. bisporus (strain H97 / ATCC MYA-4626 / FGSC 10389) TaxID=936046 RepID=UPI00029F7503|nr:hypothetical protein AGABI2DRAFT_122547 [Agaricus bisporus var. bisporus H97]EKV42977.1 hypothetical protein AGABI2DRAFT_122547 [Agaricus bisporus var. bisporus H97]